MLRKTLFRVPQKTKGLQMIAIGKRWKLGAWNVMKRYSVYLGSLEEIGQRLWFTRVAPRTCCKRGGWVSACQHTRGFSGENLNQWHDPLGVSGVAWCMTLCEFIKWHLLSGPLTMPGTEGSRCCYLLAFCGCFIFTMYFFLFLASVAWVRK